MCAARVWCVSARVSHVCVCVGGLRQRVAWGSAGPTNLICPCAVCRVVSTVRRRKREGAVSRELRILRHRLASESPLHWNKPAIQALIDDIVRVHPSLA